MIRLQLVPKKQEKIRKLKNLLVWLSPIIPNSTLADLSLPHKCRKLILMTQMISIVFFRIWPFSRKPRLAKSNKLIREKLHYVSSPIILLQMFHTYLWIRQILASLKTSSTFWRMNICHAFESIYPDNPLWYIFRHICL